MKPSDLKNITPWESVAGKSETETVAQNIMVILSRTGNNWRELPYAEYVEQRKIDGDYHESEQKHFEIAAPYCISPDKAARFSNSWNKSQQHD